jgi:hypothetical protein
MDRDIKIPSKGIIETVRERIVELEQLEATGVATADTSEMLVDLRELLAKFDTMLLERARKTLQ